LSDNDARDLAATSQFVFSQLLIEVTHKCLKKYNFDFDGIVLTGGCALVNWNTVYFGLIRH
jgi:predicted NodU family carbamoyl transferase